MPRNAKTFELSCEFRHQTDDALCIYDYASDDEHWLPFSQVEEIHGNKIKGNAITVVMTEWIARQKGFI